MKEDIGDLKHEYVITLMSAIESKPTWFRIQMEMDNHRNESRADMKRVDIRMEDVLHRTIVTIGDIRTEIEQAKWDNTRRGVGEWCFGRLGFQVSSPMNLL